MCTAAAATCLGAPYALTASVPSVSVKSQSGASYAISTSYFQAISAPPGYVASVLFVSIATESGWDYVDVFANPTTATFRTATAPVGSSLSSPLCSGTTLCSPNPVQCLYGTTMMVELYSDSSNVAAGISFAASITACPAGSY